MLISLKLMARTAARTIVGPFSFKPQPGGGLRPLKVGSIPRFANLRVLTASLIRLRNSAAVHREVCQIGGEGGAKAVTESIDSPQLRQQRLRAQHS